MREEAVYGCVDPAWDHAGVATAVGADHRGSEPVGLREDRAMHDGPPAERRGVVDGAGRTVWRLQPRTVCATAERRAIAARAYSGEWSVGTLGIR